MQTSPLICSGFYMTGTSVLKELNISIMLAISLKHNIYVKFLEMLLDNDVTSSCARHVHWQRNNHSDVRDRRHITFVTFNRFCPLGKPPPTPPLSLMDMSTDGIPTKIGWKIHVCFTLHFKFSRHSL